MESPAGLKVAFIGSGNVATHLARAMVGAGVRVVKVLSRNSANARELARTLPGADYSDDFSSLPSDLDFLVISASDDALDVIVDALPDMGRTIVVHTSGTRPAAMLASKAPRHGVLYPLQTFSKSESLDVSRVPFFTEGSDADTLGAIDSMARLISQHVAHADSERRRTLHIAGVFACNFVTYMWECAARVLQRDGYDFSAVVPLIEATAAKAAAIGPHAAQTGPARRGDIGVMKRHLEQLPQDLQDIYRLLSNDIMSSHHIDKRI